MENIKINVEEFITAVRSSFGGSIAVYTMGNCYQFYEILKVVFPNAEAYFDGNHVWTKICGNYYDIRGKANLPIDRILTPVIDIDLIRSLSGNKISDSDRIIIMKKYVGKKRQKNKI
jgi:hypothetical protein